MSSKAILPFCLEQDEDDEDELGTSLPLARKPRMQDFAVASSLTNALPGQIPENAAVAATPETLHNPIPILKSSMAISKAKPSENEAVNIGGYVSKWIKKFKVNDDNPDAHDNLHENNNNSDAKVEQTLRNRQKRAIYGKLEHGTARRRIDKEYKRFLVAELDRFSSEIPEAMELSIAQDSLQMLKAMHAGYSRQVGSKKKLTAAALRRLHEVKEFVEAGNASRQEERGNSVAASSNRSRFY
jgi:hypothetical protein